MVCWIHKYNPGFCKEKKLFVRLFVKNAYLGVWKSVKPAISSPVKKGLNIDSEFAGVIY
jgi:hypothetical protein